MAEQALTRHAGPKHQGPARTSPYGTSRLAPPHSLVDLAREIERADEVLQSTAHGKLEELAAQIRGLQKRAREIVAEARVDAILHRAQCSFIKRIGTTYHLYKRDDSEHYFSMLAPEEWRNAPHEFVGSFRLEPNRGWTPTSDPALKRRMAEALPNPTA